jgi:hypothetical protein
MDIETTLAALRPLQATHMTTQGECLGFFMVEATRARGGLDKASDALAVLLAEGLLDGKPVVISDDVHTLHTLNEDAPVTRSSKLH